MAHVHHKFIGEYSPKTHFVDFFFFQTLTKTFHEVVLKRFRFINECISFQNFEMVPLGHTLILTLLRLFDASNFLRPISFPPPPRLFFIIILSFMICYSIRVWSNSIYIYSTFLLLLALFSFWHFWIFFFPRICWVLHFITTSLLVPGKLVLVF